MPCTAASSPIGDIIISARPADDYLAQFALTEPDLLRGPVLDCPGGASDFGVHVRALGGRAVSVDPAYGVPPEHVDQRLRADFHRVTAWTATRPDRFPPGPDGRWQRLPRWQSAAQTFLDDYRRDRDEATGHYLPALLPTLPFPDRAFALATSGFLLFTYPDHFDLAFHLRALRELLRVADEVRVHPLNDSARTPYPRLDALCDTLRADGVHVDTLAVESPTDRHDTHSLRLRRPAPRAA
ncbi:SAM-dependent methyltransferase [Chondromyces apiculatus]|nr:SAM-dependent methyltransferase [Chondromyces apiculatus]